MTATHGLSEPTIDDWLRALALSPADGQHYPFEVDVDIFEDVGGQLVLTDYERQIRCGCEDSLAHDWGTAEHHA